MLLFYAEYGLKAKDVAQSMRLIGSNEHSQPLREVFEACAKGIESVEDERKKYLVRIAVLFILPSCCGP